jgi:mRNA-degrading endonuclease HigB of HigAB toxin-antitoxin module
LRSVRPAHEAAVAAETRADIKAQFRSASILGNRRVVFNIKGNRYRLITAIAYNTGIVFIKFIGTHAEYDRVDAEHIEWREHRGNSADPNRDRLRGSP